MGFENWENLYSTYEEKFRIARTLLKIVLYSYMNGDYSSRSMELNCKRDINYMFLLEGCAFSGFMQHLHGSEASICTLLRRILAEMSNALFDMGESQAKPSLSMEQKLKQVQISILSLKKAVTKIRQSF